CYLLTAKITAHSAANTPIPVYKAALRMAEANRIRSRHSDNMECPRQKAYEHDQRPPNVPSRQECATFLYQNAAQNKRGRKRTAHSKGVEWIHSNPSLLR